MGGGPGHGSGPAPGMPGENMGWAPGAKDVVTTALGPSRVWVSVGQGILHEIYWPSAGSPMTRDLGFVVAGAAGWTEVKRLPDPAVTTPAPDLPLPTIVHHGDGWTLTLEVVPDNDRDAVLVRWRLDGANLRLYPLLAPRLSRHADQNAIAQGPVGGDNEATVDADNAMVASGAGAALCLAASPPFRRASVGYVGVSDGWHDFHEHGAMTWTWGDTAGPGNVALMGECDGSEGVLAVSFAADAPTARSVATAALAEPLDVIRARFVAGWTAWSDGVTVPATVADDPDGLADALRRSAAVLRVHEDRAYPGALVAGLAAPWGNARSNLSSYHMVWPRDACESALALLACGQQEAASRTLAYLITRQHDGHWDQNFFPDGTPYFTGLQLDETALPVMLAAKLADGGAALPAGTDDMVANALRFLVDNGPLTSQDRWEEDPGASPFTVGVVVAALVAGVELLARPGGTRPLSPPEAAYVLALADNWNERIESLAYAAGGELAGRYGVEGYYVRIGASPAGDHQGRWGPRGFVEIKNPGGQFVEADLVVGLEFAYLARLGLRAADDPRLTATATVVDGELGLDVDGHRHYHRYERDGYGEAADGSPFLESADFRAGRGRLWPLLAGERGHLDLCAGRSPRAQLAAMLASAGRGGLLPEQVWDAADVPERGLAFGRPSGSAMPLAWAHAELLKLAAARENGNVPVERLAAVAARYGGGPPAGATTWFWRDVLDTTSPDGTPDAVPRGRDLVVDDTRHFVLHWGVEGVGGWADIEAEPLAFGRHGARLPAAAFDRLPSLAFTRRYDDGWENRDHVVTVVDAVPDTLPAYRANR